MIKERTELATPHLSGLLDFWLTKCIGGKPPVSSTVAPADLRPWKDNIVIFEVIGDDDFVYSYYGQSLAAAFGHSRLGATLDDLPEEQRAILRPEYASLLRERLPVARVYTADFSGVMRTWERLALPMSSDGETIDKILVAAYELPPDESPYAALIPTTEDEETDEEAELDVDVPDDDEPDAGGTTAPDPEALADKDAETDGETDGIADAVAETDNDTPDDAEDGKSFSTEQKPGAPA
ncbi:MULTISPECIES: PAS domain-containing protein [Azospirillum]|uniref:PAS domain-containing protein n=1 Tax=Azospirillum brasilense TaxID=192 RepID=A0ABU4PAW7_AZOBR|nr:MULTISPECIES: PAS domain-containing protein [Azospirillum]MDW7554104.1 PAS domain-containing protein [Azospirillum brasilense]MDW7592929.1 PAS domain-containing protein [Azospirillum brasilense]MDW7593637.1 PAS domain-containing protein [Azospirillum brasilense]MDW7627120.1 PAS domain-containing protein [Azospirillum brasilense]MDX5953176.1 PAS domain-containing protein [Azospirillum brasilense]